jgi:hypothetical protein
MSIILWVVLCSKKLAMSVHLLIILDINKWEQIKFLQSLNYTIYKLPEKKKINSHESEKIEDYIAEYKN